MNFLVFSVMYQGTHYLLYFLVGFRVSKKVKGRRILITLVYIRSLTSPKTSSNDLFYPKKMDMIHIVIKLK